MEHTDDDDSDDDDDIRYHCREQRITDKPRGMFGELTISRCMAGRCLAFLSVHQYQ